MRVLLPWVSNLLVAAIRRHLVQRDAKTKLEASFQFTIETIDLCKAVQSAKSAVSTMKFLSPMPRRDEQVGQNRIPVAETVVDPWVKLLDNIEVFTKLVDKIVEVNGIKISYCDPFNRISIGASIR